MCMCGSHRAPRFVSRRYQMGTDVGVLCGPLGGRPRHEQCHSWSRECIEAALSPISC